MSVLLLLSGGPGQVSATAAATLGRLAASGSGSIAAGSGSGSATLGRLSGSGSGQVAASGSGSALTPKLSASGSGSVAAGSGSGSATLGTLSASGTGLISTNVFGTGAATLRKLAASGAGQVAASGSGSTSLARIAANSLRPWEASTFDVDLNAYLTQSLGLPVYAPLKRGLKFRSPTNVVSTDPIVSYRRIHDHRPSLLSGAAGVVDAYYQIDLYCPYFDALLVLNERLRYSMQGFAGHWGASEVLNCTLFDQAYFWLENLDPKLIGVYRIMTEYRIHYRESVRVFPAA